MNSQLLMKTERACGFMLEWLTALLPPQLMYHSADHTRDVMAQAGRIARAEGVADPEQCALLRTAACYHDAGFLVMYDEHEAESCRLAREYLPAFDYSPAQIEQVCELIGATRLPQTPTTPLAAILCDADLDYLGRVDYGIISERLRAEWIAHGRLPDPDCWPDLQRKFLSSHQYFTATNQKLREAGKQQTLAAL